MGLFSDNAAIHEMLLEVRSARLAKTRAPQRSQWWELPQPTLRLHWPLHFGSRAPHIGPMGAAR